MLESRDVPSFATPVNYNVGTQADGFVPNAAPINVVKADFNADGKLDLAVSHKADNSVYLLAGNGNGTFQTAVRVAVGTGIEGREFVGDFNGDGKPDLFLPGAAKQAIVLLGNGNGTFQPRVESSSFSVAGTYPRGWGVGDFNGDGKLDVASTTPSNTADSGGLVVLLGNGNGTFQSGLAGPTNLHYSRWMTTGDFNGDGRLDIATADGQGTSAQVGTAEVSILLGNGNGTFNLLAHYPSPQLPDDEEPNATANPEDVFANDLNADGVLDLVVCDYDNTINVFVGNGNGTFQTPRSYNPGHYPRGVVVADFDLDGKLDLVVTNVGINTGGALFPVTGAEPGSLGVLRGNGNGTFQAAVQYQPFVWPGWSAVGDFNGDGALDLAVTQVLDGHAVGVLLNSTGKDRNFVRALYQDALGRTPGLPEIDPWLDALPALGRGGVAQAITGSHEAHHRQVRSVYTTYLGRSANGTEESGWVNLLDQGATLEQVLSGILSVAEFANRADSLEGTADGNTNFIRALYHQLLFRTGSPTDVAGWTGQLASASRAEVARRFLSSQEFRATAARGYYGATQGAVLAWVPNLLKRGTAFSGGEITSWATSPFDLLTMGLLIAGSAEYYARA